MSELNDIIYDYVSTHEVIETNRVRKKDEDIPVRFTKFGNRSSCKSIREIISLLDDKNKKKVLFHMDNRRVLDE